MCVGSRVVMMNTMTKVEMMASCVTAEATELFYILLCAAVIIPRLVVYNFIEVQPRQTDLVLSISSFLFID